ATWDFPAMMTDYDGTDPDYGVVGGNSALSYGTSANFKTNYWLSSDFLSAHKAPFVAQNRIWIGGYQAFQQDMTDYGALLTAQGILHATETPTPMTHSWTGGWVPLALTALYQDSVGLGN